MNEKRINRLGKQVSAFGRARSPLDQLVHNERIVVAGPQLLSIPFTWSFHEFLISYGRSQLGIDWIAKNEVITEPHPLVSYLRDGLSGIRPTGLIDGHMVGLALNAGLQAFIAFAYDLFTVADNALIQSSLLVRIRNHDQYQGARYELYCAASLVRAGFKLEFEDESDSTRSHCEFAATHKKTGRAFSVEAKSRHRSESQTKVSEPPVRIYKIMQDALKKEADHERIVFMDVNLPPDSAALFEQGWHKEVAGTLKALERDQRTDDPWPQAIVFFTNRKTFPWFGQSDSFSGTVLLTAINHPLFKNPNRGHVERAYPEIGQIFHAVDELGAAPSHFVGQ